MAWIAGVVGTGLLVGGFDARAMGATTLDWAAGFGSAIAFSFYIVYSKRGLARYSPTTVLFYTFLIAGIFWATVTPPWKILAAGYDRAVWGPFPTTGIASELLPFRTFFR